MDFFLKHIEAMAAYVPGESGDGSRRIVKLNQNENPYPPSPRVREALDAFDCASLRVYPDPLADVFRREVASLHGVPIESIAVGDGSDDLIIILARAAADADRAIAFSEPNFPYYRTQAEVQNAPVLCPPADTDSFAHPLAALAECNAALTFVANPNSPTGATAPVAELAELAGKLDGILVIDEAYGDFAGISAIPLAFEFDNVLVMRTLSKAYSLAGLRIGYAIAGETIMAGLMKARAIYNVGSLPAAVAAAAVSDRDYHRRCIARIVEQRERTAAELHKRRWRVWPSGGNFVMARPPGGAARETFEALKARDVLVRYFSRAPMTDKLRISIGTPDDTDALIAAVDACAR